MGEIVLAAKITHVPTILLSEQPGKLQGCRRQAIEVHRQRQLIGKYFPSSRTGQANVIFPIN